MTHAILSTLIPFKLSIPFGVDVVLSNFLTFDIKENVFRSSFLNSTKKKKENRSHWAMSPCPFREQGVPLPWPPYPGQGVVAIICHGWTAGYSLPNPPTPAGRTWDRNLDRTSDKTRWYLFHPERTWDQRLGAPLPQKGSVTIDQGVPSPTGKNQRPGVPSWTDKQTENTTFPIIGCGY